MRTSLIILALVSCGQQPKLAKQSPAKVRLSVENKCSFDVWMASTPNSSYSPLPDSLVKVAPGGSHAYKVSVSGWAGRFWPKVGCDSQGNNCKAGQSVAPCPDGGCQPPADTKVEFNFPPGSSKDTTWYDISLVDGYSLPLSITPSKIGGSCISTQCDLKLDECPSNEIDNLGSLQVKTGGQVVQCLSPCKKWNYPPPWGMGKNEGTFPGLDMCCPTPPVTPTSCQAGDIERTKYVKLVRSECPTAYSYAYDDYAGLHTCPLDTNFTVVLCP